jgi:hypothetical protein
MGMLVLLGGGGHAAVVKEIAVLHGVGIQGYYDRNQTTLDLKWLGPLPTDTLPSNIDYICCVGDNQLRERITITYPTASWVKLVHPRAVVASDVSIGVGSVVCAGAILEVGAVI